MYAISGSYLTVPPAYQTSRANIESGFSISAWLQTAPNTNGFVLAKTTADGNRHYYAVKVVTNSLTTALEFRYTVATDMVCTILIALSLFTTMKYIS